MPARIPARQRLADLMERRRLDLGLTWREVAEAGNISYEVIRAIRNGNGQIRPLSKRGIEVGLHWEPGSVQRIEDGGDPVNALPAVAPPGPALVPEPSPEPAEPAGAGVLADVIHLARRVNKPVEEQVRAEVRQAKARHRGIPLEEVPEAGAEAYGQPLPADAIPTFDTMERLAWNLVVYPEEWRVGYIALLRAMRAERQSPPQRRRATG